MSKKRVMPDAVLLPDGTVLVVGGAEQGQIAHARTPVLAAECYDPGPGPGAGQWHPRASMNIPRGYHATALLLPDGRVMSAGSADNTRDDPNPSAGTWQPQGAAAEFRVEVFKPPYLYNRASPNEGPPRPEILEVLDVNRSPSAMLHYSSDGGANHFFVKSNDLLGRDITAVVLIRSSSVTHGFNADQRYVGLYFEEKVEERADEGRTRILEVTPPPHGHVAPPGFYMLFIVTGTRTDYHSEAIDGDFKCPSEAKFVRLFERPN